MQAIQIRRLAPGDSLEDLTSMLHRAFSNLGRAGFNCTAVDQTTRETAARVRLGDCYVAVCGGRIIGSVTLHKPDGNATCKWYGRPGVATLHQFAVDPSFQGTGCGKGLLLVAMRWARDHQYRELALNTPAPAAHLIKFYQSQGFLLVEHVQLPGKSYRSSVLSKSVCSAPMARHSLRRASPRRTGALSVGMALR